MHSDIYVLKVCFEGMYSRHVFEVCAQGMFLRYHHILWTYVLTWYVLDVCFQERKYVFSICVEIYVFKVYVDNDCDLNICFQGMC